MMKMADVDLVFLLIFIKYFLRHSSGELTARYINRYNNKYNGQLQVSTDKSTVQLFIGTVQTFKRKNHSENFSLRLSIYGKKILTTE